MPVNAYATHESIATEHHHDANLVLIDEEGREHYWSIYDQAVVVVDDDGVNYDLSFPVRSDDGSEIRNPGDWRGHVERRGGVAKDLTRFDIERDQ